MVKQETQKIFIAYGICTRLQESRIMKGLECSGLEFDIRIPTMLASCYREKGMEGKADKLMNKAMRNRGFARPITPLLEEVGKKGNQVKPSELRDLIKNLGDLNQFSKALEVSEWMCQKRVCSLVSEDYAARLHMINNVLGVEEAEKFFKSNIPENMKDYSVYATLLTSYTRSSNTLGKANAIFKKMGELGFLSRPSPFNSMISLYSQLGRRNKVEDLLCKMKENNIEPDSHTMNNVLRMYADKTDIERMEKYKIEYDSNIERRTMVEMGNAYERAGLILMAIETTWSKQEVYRLWDEYKKKDVRAGNEGYRTTISALLKLGDVKGAENIYLKWVRDESVEFDSGIPYMLIYRYCEEDNEVEVRQVMKSIRRKRILMKFKMFKEVVCNIAKKN